MENYLIDDEENKHNLDSENDDETRDKSFDVFEIDSLSKADWCFKKIKEYTKKKIQMEEYVKEEENRLKEFKKKEQEKYENNIEHFQILLRNYMDKELENDPNFKIKTLNGSANYGKKTKKLDYNDKDMIEFCKKNDLPQFIRTKEELNKSEFKTFLTITDENKVVTKDGEILDNITVIEEQKFNIRCKE